MAFRSKKRFPYADHRSSRVAALATALPHGLKTNLVTSPLTKLTDWLARRRLCAVHKYGLGTATCSLDMLNQSGDESD